MSTAESPSRATIADVAEKAGVSIATVSRVINKTAVVTDETAARVHAAIKALNYTPRAAARGLASRKTNTIGLLLPEISGGFFPPMLRGIETCVTQHGLALLIYSTRGRDMEETNLHLPLGEHNTDGLLIFTDSLAEEQLVRMHNNRFPMVLLHKTSPAEINVPCVTVENKAGANKLVSHLIETHGYRRIAFLTGPPNNEDSYWRETGYREALAAHDIPFDPALVSTGGFDEEEAQDAVEQWLLEGVEMDAIFAGDDEAAMGVITALRRARKRIPQDIAVVGFDDLPLSRHLTPALTTVAAPIEEAGRVAAEQLIRLIRKEYAKPLTLLPTGLVIRHSCGC